MMLVEIRRSAMWYIENICEHMFTQSFLLYLDPDYSMPTNEIISKQNNLPFSFRFAAETCVNFSSIILFLCTDFCWPLADVLYWPAAYRFVWCLKCSYQFFILFSFEWRCVSWLKHLKYTNEEDKCGEYILKAHITFVIICLSDTSHYVWYLRKFT